MNYIRNLLNEEFILCYTKKGMLIPEWTCEQGYKSLDEIERHIDQSMILHDKITTVILTRKYYPMLINKWKVYACLQPYIHMRIKMSYTKDEL